jgi:hypothetical protein
MTASRVLFSFLFIPLLTNRVPRSRPSSTGATSSSRGVGTATADEDGRVAMTITEPADALSGEHDLTVWGTNEAGYNIGPRSSLSTAGGEQ